MRAAIALLLVLQAKEAAACSAESWDENDLVENEPVWSANGRFAAVVRWHEGIADFTPDRAGKVFGFDEPERENEDKPPREVVTAGLYELRSNGRSRMGDVSLDVRGVDSVLVSDSGRFVIAVRRLRTSCGRRTTLDDPVVTIYRTDGSRVATLKAGDIVDEYDLVQLWIVESNATLRYESDTREVVALSFPKGEERRIDIATGALLDAKRPIFPRPRVFASAVDDSWQRRPYVESPEDCAAAWDDRDIDRLESNELLASAVDMPMPAFPDLALKARIRGTVQVEVLVSEGGLVLCTRYSRMPFSIDKAASDGVREWRFRRTGRKIAGELLMHFKDVAVE